MRAQPRVVELNGACAAKVTPRDRSRRHLCVCVSFSRRAAARAPLSFRFFVFFSCLCVGGARLSSGLVFVVLCVVIVGGGSCAC